MNFADRMKQETATPKNKTITITLDEYAKAGTEAMARILGDALQFGLPDEIMPALVAGCRLIAVAIRDELFGGAEDD